MRVRWSRQQRAKTRSKRDFINIRQSRAAVSGKNRWFMNDPKWSQMWYLVSDYIIDLLLTTWHFTMWWGVRRMNGVCSVLVSPPHGFRVDFLFQTFIFILKWFPTAFHNFHLNRPFSFHFPIKIRH